MSTTLPPVAENPDQFGRFTIVSRDMDDNGQITGVHRAPQEPGRWVDGVWVPADIANLPKSVQPFAQDLWTADAIDRFKAAFPWVPPPPPEAPVLQPYQFFAMLEISGKTAVLDAFIDALPAPQNIVARAKLDRSLAFHRDNDLVLAAQQALGLTDAELDALWTQAASL